jgi:hypothetical protein
MAMYKIRNTKTGLYSKGGDRPSWSKAGKVWKRLGDLSSHFTQVGARGRSVYQDAEVVEFELVEKLITPAINFVQEADRRRQDKIEEAEQRRRDYQFQHEQAELKRLLAKHGVPK